MRELLTKKEAGRLVRLHPESLMRLARKGTFPAPLKLNGHSVRFDKAEVEDWIADQRRA